MRLLLALTMLVVEFEASSLAMDNYDIHFEPVLSF